MISFNTLISRFIPFLPKVLAYQFAKRYVAGTSKESAFKVIQNLNNSGYLVTLDILGEHTTVLDNSNAVGNKDLDILNNIKSNNLDCNISLEPTHIGSDISTNFFNINIG